jgi:hypothetical protein
LRASAEAIGQWRKQPVVLGTEKMAVSFLKHAEDQTVLALMTVRVALEQQGWQEHSFAPWGVIAAPNLFGRISIAQTIQRYHQEGAWGVSPHLIPHQSLHAMSGTISQALKIVGPNLGVNGGPNAGPDAFLIAAAMMMDGQLPGLWLVLTGYESEWIPVQNGANGVAPMCEAIALALTPKSPNGTGPVLTVGQVSNDAKKDLSLLPEFHLGLLAEEMSSRATLASGKWRLSETHWLELEAEERS